MRYNNGVNSDCQKLHRFAMSLRAAGYAKRSSSTNENTVMDRVRIVSDHPDVVSGALVFAGTRVPVQILIDYLNEGETLGLFLEGFPTVSREQAEAFLEVALHAVEAEMRVLLDENIDRLLKGLSAPEFDVMTVSERGWQGKANGELLRFAEREFDAFVTMDRNLEYQQKLRTLDLGVVVLRARSNAYRVVAHLMPRVNERLRSVQPGEVLHLPV